MKTRTLIFTCVIVFAGCTCSDRIPPATQQQVAALQEKVQQLETAAETYHLRNGMIKHTVIFDLKYEPNAPQAKLFLQDGYRILSALPMVRNFEVFRQTSPKNDYDFGFSMVFEDQAAYQAYNDHPDHVKFVRERWDTEVSRFLEADFIHQEN